MAPKTITVKCPQCDRVYITWDTPAIDERSEKQRTTACSQCGHRSLVHELVEKDGVLQKDTL